MVKTAVQSAEAIQVDASVEHIKQFRRGIIKTQNRECLFKRTEEAAFRGGNFSKKTVRAFHSLREEFKLKGIHAVVDFPKAIYIHWQKRFESSYSGSS